MEEAYSYGDEDYNLESWYEFDYSQINKQIVTMSYQETRNPQEQDITTLFLNSDGAVEKAKCVSSDGTEEWYEFSYNSDRQLNYMKRYDEDGDIEITNMKYDNGSLVEVNEDDGDTFYMTYTSEDMLTPIANKAGLMYKCDIIWGIDLDEFNFAYLAGLLGKAPAYLPITTRVYEEGYEYETYYNEWKLDNNDIPTVLISNDKYGSETYKYHWTKTETGINNITNNIKAPNIKATYTINGAKIKGQQKGLNIIRYSDGTTRKIVSK